MAEYIYLVGAEDVSRAARNMQEAASTISSAIASLDNALMQNQQFLNDWLYRFEEILKKPEENEKYIVSPTARLR